MNTQEIEVMMKQNKVTQKLFKGVYAADEVPDDIKKSCFVIVNMDPSTEAGSHWVAMMVNPGRRSEYFDSFGLPVPYPRFERILGGRYIMSKEQLQASYTTTCGQWCMFYVWCRCAKYTFKQIISMFKKKDRIQNDANVNDFIEKEFNTEQHVVDLNFLKGGDGDNKCCQCCCDLRTIAARLSTN